MAMRPTHTVGSVDSSATGQILPANTGRTYGLLQNDSAVVIYLFLGTGPAALSTGIRLAAAGSAGSSYEMSEKIGNVWKGAIQAIAASSSANKVLITEGMQSSN